MLNKVREQRPSYNNASAITSSVSVSRLKLAYYQLFARAYSFVGSCADSVMVNSSWTRAHIAELWGYNDREKQLSAAATQTQKAPTSTRAKVAASANTLHLVYPPCNTTDLHKNLTLRRPERTARGERLVVSIGQFRPEKDHFLQLQALKALKDMGSG